MSGSTQTISTAVTGPVFSNGGAIAITNTGSISKGREGVFAKNFSITTLSNMGSIGAATGAPGRAGGIGVKANSGRTIDLLTNANGATISGGNGGGGRKTGAAGGAGIANSGAITELTNSGTIQGGHGGHVAGSFGVGGAGGAGVSNAGTIRTLSNSGKITGGNGGNGISRRPPCCKSRWPMRRRNRAVKSSGRRIIMRNCRGLRRSATGSSNRAAEPQRPERRRSRDRSGRP
jgi:hypothetical protein